MGPDMHLECLKASLKQCLQVYGMSSEDMDSLTFGATRLVRNLMAPAAAKLTINEYDYDKAGPPPTIAHC